MVDVQVDKNNQWESYKLGDIASFRRGSFPQPYGLSKWYDDVNGLPFVQVYDVDDNLRLKSTTKRKISKAAADQSVFIKRGTLIITIQGSIGRVAITQYDAYIDRTLLLFTAFHKPLDKRYFQYQLLVLFDLERQKANGSTIKTITKEQLSSFKIPLPPLPEQKKIATILSTVDEAIQNVKAQIERTKELKKGLMQKLFSEGIGHTEFKESKLGRIPKEWEVVRLSYFLDLITYGFTSPMPTTTEGPYMITAKDVKYGKLQIESCRRTAKTKFDELSEKCKPHLNDILLTKDGTLGRLALVDVEGICINQSVALLRPNEFVDPLFLKLLLESSRYQKRMIEDAGGSTIKHIYITIVDKMKIAYPIKLEEQVKIAKIISQVDSKLESLSKDLNFQNSLKKGLMQKLLTGEVRVRVN